MPIDSDDRKFLMIIVGIVVLALLTISTIMLLKHRQIETMAKLGYCQTTTVGTSELIWEKCYKTAD